MSKINKSATLWSAIAKIQPVRLVANQKINTIIDFFVSFLRQCACIHWKQRIKNGKKKKKSIRSKNICVCEMFRHIIWKCRQLTHCYGCWAQWLVLFAPFWFAVHSFACFEMFRTFPVAPAIFRTHKHTHDIHITLYIHNHLPHSFHDGSRSFQTISIVS